MMALIVIGVIIIFGIKELIQSTYYSTRSRMDSFDKDNPYYTDWSGDTRRTDNGHKVAIHQTQYSWGGKKGDTVDIDLVTGEVLRNYSQEKRDKELEDIISHEEKNKKAKQEAIENGRYIYSSWKYVGSKSVTGWDLVTRRVSDDLEVIWGYTKCCDAKYHFLLWRDEKVYIEQPTLHSLEDDLADVRWTIDYNVKHNNANETELIEYAKKIKAIGWETLP